MIATALLLLAPIVAQAEGQKAILVLDASGSMWGQIDGKPKIAIAREVIADVLKGWNPENEIGLVTYGHRRKGDCADIEALVPVGKLDAGKFNKAVADLNPKGKTPMTEAARQAAMLLKYTEEKATVILVSDGKETCAADPCAVAAELEKSGVDFTAHVIGFDVEEKEGVTQLQCMANQTGGEFLTAKNASDLKLALGKAVERVAKPDPKAPVNLHLTAVMTAGGEKVGGNWFVVQREEADAAGEMKRVKVDANGYYADVNFRLPPGDYIVSAANGKAYAEERITVEAGKGSEVELNLNGGWLKARAIMTAGGDKVGGNWFAVQREGTDEFGKPKRVKVDANGYYAENTFTLPAGDYIVSAANGKAYAEEKVTVEAGKGVDVELNLNAGWLKTRAIMAAGGDKVGGNWFAVHREGTDEFGKPKRLQIDASGYYAENTFTLPAGDYIASAANGKAYAEEKVTVEAGKGGDVELNLNAGWLKVFAVLEPGGKRLGGNWFAVHREETDEAGKPKRLQVDANGYYAENTFTLPAGDYIAAASRGKMYGERKVAVEAGKGVEAELLLALPVPDYAKALGDGKWQAWESSQGDMGLLRTEDGRLVGFYIPNDRGRLLLELKGNVASGYWVENESRQRCDSERDGSFHWGRIRWEFNQEMTAFSGWWSYCEAESGDAWTGKRQ